MGKRGPKPDPVQIKQAKGNPGRRPLGDTPSGKSLPPGPPDWMNRWSKEEWRRLRRILTPKGLLIEKYRGNFEMLCFDFGMWRECAMVVNKKGLTFEEPVTNKKGELLGYRIKTRPEVFELRKAQHSYYRRGAAFGLTPSDDGDLGLKTPGVDDPMDDVMATKKRG